MRQLMVRKIAQQEISRCHHGNIAELQIIPRILGNDNVATSSNSTLVLKKIFEIPNILMAQRFVQLLGISWENRDSLAKSANKLIAIAPWRTTLNVIDIGVREVRNTILNHTSLPQIDNSFCKKGVIPAFSKINQYICIQKYFHLSPKIYLVRSSAASSGVNLNHSTSSCVSGDTLISAIFLARNSSSALRFASSTSRMASFRNSMTMYMSLTFIPRISPKYGAIGVDWICLAAVVITPLFLRCKDKNNFKQPQYLKKYFIVIDVIKQLFSHQLDIPFIGWICTIIGFSVPTQIPGVHDFDGAKGKFFKLTGTNRHPLTTAEFSVTHLLTSLLRFTTNPTCDGGAFFTSTHKVSKCYGWSRSVVEPPG